MKLMKLAAALALSAVSSLGLASDYPFSKLQALQGLENGQWHLTFTTIPRQPAIPDHDERGCADVAKYMERAMRKVQETAQQCRIEVNSDTPAKAELTSQCPAMQIMPGLALPALQIHYYVQRLAQNEVQVDAVAPNFLTGSGNITFRHKATRLGACERK